MRSEKIINLFYLLELTQFFHFQNVNFFLEFCIYRILYNNDFSVTNSTKMIDTRKLTGDSVFSAKFYTKVFGFQSVPQANGRQLYRKRRQ